MRIRNDVLFVLFVIACFSIPAIFVGDFIIQMYLPVEIPTDAIVDRLKFDLGTPDVLMITHSDVSPTHEVWKTVYFSILHGGQYRRGECWRTHNTPLNCKLY